MCKQVKLNNDDMEDMTVGMCLDYIDEHVKQKDPKAKQARNATQNDYDSF